MSKEAEVIADLIYKNNPELAKEHIQRRLENDPNLLKSWEVYFGKAERFCVVPVIDNGQEAPTETYFDNADFFVVREYYERGEYENIARFHGSNLNYEDAKAFAEFKNSQVDNDSLDDEIFFGWTHEDIKTQVPDGVELSNAEIREIGRRLAGAVDANYGMSWETISLGVKNYLKETCKKVFLCQWDEEVFEGQPEKKVGMDFFNADNGYDKPMINAIEKLEIGEEFQSPHWAKAHTITRIH